MVKRYVVSLAAATLVSVGTAGAAFADPAQHTSETFTGTFTFDAPVTCDGGPTYTLTHNVITDELVTTSGHTWRDRSTLTDSFTGTPLDPSLPTVTGITTGPAIFTFRRSVPLERQPTDSRPRPTLTARSSRHTKLSISP